MWLDMSHSVSYLLYHDNMSTITVAMYTLITSLLFYVTAATNSDLKLRQKKIQNTIKTETLSINVK